jgi:DNA-binding beta-propeller fold protein YncE
MWPIKQAVARAALAAVIASAGAGCTASGDAVQPDGLRLFFPTGAAVSPDGKLLFVANANSDLKYNAGSISVLPLEAVEAVVAGWQATRNVPPDPEGQCTEDTDETDDAKRPTHSCCERDKDFTETLVCDEDRFLRATQGEGVKIGNFATDLAIQDLGDGRLRVIVPTRGDPSIAWADWDPAASRLACNTEELKTPFHLCDDDHRLAFVRNDDTLASIPEEPFGVFADTAGQFAMITHLTTGAVTLIDSPRDGDVMVTDIQQGVFNADPTTGLRGSTGIAGRTPRAPGDIVYVGSRSEDRIQTFTVGRPANGERPFLLRGSWFFLDGVGNNVNTNSGSDDTRGMTFSPSGDRLYLVNRKPPSLQIYDTSLDATGTPKHELVGAVDICRQASTVTAIDSGDGERAYLTCFQDGQIYVIDPRGHGRVEDVITVGRGPYTVVAAPGGQRLYVTNFLEDTVSVIDLTPGSPTRYRVVLRIGEPRSL